MRRYSLFLAFAVFTFFVVGFYFETNDDLQCDLLFKGLLTPEPIPEIRVLFPYLSTCFSFLYTQFPSFPTYSLFVMLSCIVFIGLASRFLGLTVFRHTSFEESFLTCLVLYFLVLLPHLVMIQFSRFSLLIPYLCLLLLWKEDGKKLRVLYLLLFLFYSLMRSQSLPLVLFLFGLTSIASLLSNTSFKVSTFLVISVPLVSLFAFVALFWHQQMYIQSDPFLSNDLPYIVDVVNNHSTYPLQTKGDSVTFSIMERWMMGDRQWLNQEHLSRIAPGTLVSWYKIKLKYYDLWENKIIFLLCTKYLAVSLFSLLVLIKLFWKRKRLFYLYGSYLALFMGLCGGITLLMKMPDHLAEPLICMLFLSSVFLLPRECSFSMAERKLLLVAVLPFLGYSTWQYKDLGSTAEHAVLVWQEAEKEICGKEIVVGDNSLYRFSNYPIFAQMPFLSCNRHLIIGGWTGWLPETQDQIRHLTGNKDLSALFIEHPNRLWLMAEGEEKLYEELVSEAYGKNIRFQPCGHPGPHMQAVDMAWFTLKDQ